MLLAHSRIAVAAARVRIAAHCGAASSQAAGVSLWQRRALSAAVSPAGAASGSHGGTPVAGRQHLPTDLSRDLQSGVDHAQATPAFLPDALSAEESAQLVVPVRVDRPGENLEAKRSRLL